MAEPSLQEIYRDLSETIFRAETLTDAGMHKEARELYRQVSNLEQLVSEMLPPTHEEGALARRGAIRAAIGAQDFRRAKLLAARYLGEAACTVAESDPQVEDLRTLEASADASLFAGGNSAGELARRFPTVCDRYSPQALLEFAKRRAEMGAAFPFKRAA